MIPRVDFMVFRVQLLGALLLVGFLVPTGMVAQSDNAEPSLGDLARALRKSKAAPAPPVVIDNDNLSQLMDEVQSRRLQGTMLFSVDEAGKGFQVSSPDVTCNLSFSAQATSLLSDPFVPQDLPASELLKLEGPASLNGESFEVSVHNGSQWQLREITVGLTILRRPENAGVYYGTGRVIPAAQTTNVSSEKHADMTVLFRLKGNAAPSATGVFRETLSTPLRLDQDWHWAIVQAKGIPPKPAGN